MTRKTAETRIENLMKNCDGRTKINMRFDIQRTFGADNEITHKMYEHLIERVNMQIFADQQRKENNV